MRERFCSLVVIAPGAPSTFKIHLSRSAIACLIIAFVLSFLAVVCAAYLSPARVDDLQRARLEAENNVLKAEASNAAVHLQKLSARVLKLEAKSQEITELIEQ